MSSGFKWEVARVWWDDAAQVHEMLNDEKEPWEPFSAAIGESGNFYIFLRRQVWKK